MNLIRVFMALLLLFAVASPTGVKAEPFTFTVPPVDDVEDVHGDPANPDLVVFMAGNQFMVMDDLMAAFQTAHPEVKRIFFETFPPGIVARQIAAGGIRLGNLVVTTPPDVFLSGHGRMLKMVEGGLVGKPFAYATNNLAIMVAKGNPLHITGMKDLGKPNVRVSMPNPEWEGIGKQIVAAYKLAGGPTLVDEIMTAKVKSGSTILTRIHHRQTPLAILDGRADAGPVWISEGMYQVKLGKPIEFVKLADAQNVTGKYEAAMMSKPLHEKAGKAFLEFLVTPAAQAIYRAYGFTTLSQTPKSPEKE